MKDAPDTTTRRRQLEKAAGQFCVMLHLDREIREVGYDFGFVEGTDLNSLFELGAALMELPLNEHPQPAIEQMSLDDGPRWRTRAQLEAGASMLVMTYYLASSVGCWEDAINASWAEEHTKEIMNRAWWMMACLGEVLRQPGEKLLVEGEEPAEPDEPSALAVVDGDGREKREGSS